MKKFLSISFTAFLAFSAYSQTVFTENFNAYTTGNLGTQGGWARDGGGSAAWTKVAAIDATHGKSLQLASPASNTGVYEYHDSNWSLKSDDNNIFVLDMDYYTGAGGDGVGVVQMYDVDADYALPFETGWDPTNGYIYLADENDGIVLDENPVANTWYHFKISYDTNTGDIKAKLNNGEVMEYAGEAGLSPTEFDVLLYSVTNSGFDNIVISATNSDPFLAVSDVNAAKAKLSIYPNPVTNLINLKSESKIAQVSIFDATGKVVKTTSDTTINVESLAKGLYVVNIKFADGSTESKKVIKK